MPTNATCDSGFDPGSQKNFVGVFAIKGVATDNIPVSID